MAILTLTGNQSQAFFKSNRGCCDLEDNTLLNVLNPKKNGIWCFLLSFRIYLHTSFQHQIEYEHDSVRIVS